MSRRPIGIGIIGLGRISEAHELGYQSVPERARVMAVCDSEGERAARRASAYEAMAYTDYHDLLDDDKVEAVDIILPHYLHYQVALDAIRCGKHVLVEKPLATSSAHAVALCDAARRAGVTFTVAENTRFVRAYVEAARLLERDILGELRLLRTFISGSEISRLRTPGHWKHRKEGSGGGAIMDSGPHSIYLLTWLAGEIANVRGFSHRVVKESEVEDNAIVTGRLKRGAIFTSEYSFTAEVPWSERLEIYGSEGSLIVDQLVDPPARQYRSSRDFDPVPLTGVPYDPMGWKRQSIAAGVADFIHAIWEGRCPTVDPTDGVYAVKVIEKVYESIATETVVQV